MPLYSAEKEVLFFIMFCYLYDKPSIQGCLYRRASHCAWFPSQFPHQQGSRLLCPFRWELSDRHIAEVQRKRFSALRQVRLPAAQGRQASVAPSSEGLLLASPDSPVDSLPLPLPAFQPGLLPTRLGCAPFCLPVALPVVSPRGPQGSETIKWGVPDIKSPGAASGWLGRVPWCRVWPQLPEGQPGSLPGWQGPQSQAFPSACCVSVVFCYELLLLLSRCIWFLNEASSQVCVQEKPQIGQSTARRGPRPMPGISGVLEHTTVGGGAPCPRSDTEYRSRQSHHCGCRATATGSRRALTSPWVWCWVRASQGFGCVCCALWT